GGVDAFGRVLHLVPRLEVHLRGGGGAWARERVSHRCAVVSAVPGHRVGGREHERQHRSRWQDARLPPSDGHASRGAVGRGTPAVASQRRRRGGAGAGAARAVRLPRRVGRLGVRLGPQAAGVRCVQEISARLPAARRSPNGLARPVARALELSDVRGARLRRGGRESPRLDRLRTEVHRRRVASLGRLSLRRPDEGLDIVARLPYVDSTRIGAAGASYGGYMVYWMAGHTNRFKALVAHDGVFDPASMAGSTEELWFVDWEFGGPPYASRALYEKWSPLNF